MSISDTHARATATEWLLASLERLISRHRGLALHPDHAYLHIELIATEVAQEVSLARSALHGGTEAPPDGDLRPVAAPPRIRRT